MIYAREMKEKVLFSAVKCQKSKVIYAFFRTITGMTRFKTDESSGPMILKNNGGGAEGLRRLVVFWRTAY